MSNIEKYKKYFTKEYLMGPNSFRLLDELIRRCPEDVKFDRTLDLGCGYALTSLFIANETDAKHVYAFDLWVPATENYTRIKANGLVDKIIPIYGDAMDMPFAQDYFDSIVSVDSYHYFGCRKGVFAEKILPFVKENGYVMIAIPGLKEQPQGEIKKLFETWAEGDDSELFKTAEWWEALLKDECGDRCEVRVLEADCYDIAWQEWFQSGHEFGLRDKEFLDKGLYDILNFLLIYVRKKMIVRIRRSLQMIREVFHEDIPACVNIIKQSFKTVADEFGFTEENAPRFTAFAINEERLLWQFDNENRPMYVYEEAGVLCGYYSLLIQENNECELNNLAVLPEYRHKGIGKQLLEHAYSVARDKDCKLMNIGIVEENTKLRKWYEENGAVHLGTHKFDFFPFTCGYMRKKL